MESLTTGNYSKFALGSGIVFASMVTHYILHRKEIQSEQWPARIFVVTAASGASFVFGFLAAPLLWPIVIADYFARN